MTDAPAELVHLDVADGVATITLDSPHNRNALSRQLVTELVAHLATVDAADDVRVVLLKSSGRVFCSGADLSEASTVPMQEGARAIVGLQRHQHEARGMREMLVQRPWKLRAGGEMNEAIALVVERSAINAGFLGALPFVDRKNLENLHVKLL